MEYDKLLKETQEKVAALREQILGKAFKRKDNILKRVKKKKG